MSNSTIDDIIAAFWIAPMTDTLGQSSGEELVNKVSFDPHSRQDDGSISPELMSPRRIIGVYKAVLTSTFYSSVIALLFLFCTICPAYYLRLVGASNAEPPFFLIVVAAGALGSLFSSLVRLYRLDNIKSFLISDPVSSLDSWALTIYSLSSIIIGMIAAAVLYVLFSSELVKGSLFPEFHCAIAQGKCTSFFSYLDQWSPVDAASYGKSLVWGFIAGFAERMIPDALSKLSISLSQGVSGKN